MKKIKDNWKKIVGLICCAFVLVGALTFSNTRAFAATTSDGGVVGTSNLNGTAQNSAGYGDQLTAPEIGWKRYDDKDSRIQYTGSGWSEYTYSGFYLGTDKNTSTEKDKIDFYFNGTSLRIIGQLHPVASNNTKINIDGVEYHYSEYSSTAGSFSVQRLVFEKNDLTVGIHKVEITEMSTATLRFDAIDINDSGNLVDPGKVILATGISLDKTSLDMHPEDTNTIIATVTPENATNKSVLWTSSNPSVVTVDQNGNIKAVGEGTAIITATTQDGSNLSATCTINVKKADVGNALLTVTMTDGQQRTYDLSMTQVNDFITWYNNRAGGQGGFTYSFKKPPVSGAYSKRTEYLIFDKISNSDIDEYKAN
jgi:Bacterial surface proteins containing Ig-like domains